MPSSRVSRRSLLQTSAAFLGSSAAWEPWTATLCGADAPARLTQRNRFPNMVHEYYVEQLRETERRGNERRAALRTKADAEAYVADVRRKIQACFGPWPEKTPLNARTTGVVERDTYTIEKVIFESRPQFFVTANLYVPKGLKGKAPGVVGSCGHSTNGKENDTYQSFAQGLVRLGYVCLLFDPMGQGERLQLPDANNKPRVSFGVGEHMMCGNQQTLVGEFFGSWRAWDGIRALDYLLTRDEVDPNHVGITGNSGGGTMSTWLCGVESRWTMGAPSCFVTTFRRNLENELPADTEQCPPRVLALGLDMSDFLAAMAPKPVLVIGQEKDYFDVRGTTETVERLKHLYGLLGKPDNVALFIGANGHGYHQDGRQAMYGWFNHATGRDGTVVEPEIKIEPDGVLRCTESGQIAMLHNKSVSVFTHELAAEQTKGRGTPSGEALKHAVRDVLKLDERRGVPDYRILRADGDRGYPTKQFATYAVETEPGIHAIVYRLSDEAFHSRLPRQANRAVLYVAHDSSDEELRSEPLIGEIFKAEPAATFYTCDVRGLGESRPVSVKEGSYYTAYGCDYFYASHAIMLDRPYVGRRTHDVLRVLDWLAAAHDEVHVIGRGFGAIPAAMASLLHEKVTQVTLKQAPTSYGDIAAADIYGWPVSSFPRNVLKRFDLTDVYRELAAKKLKLIEPVGPEGIKKA